MKRWWLVVDGAVVAGACRRSFAQAVFEKLAVIAARQRRKAEAAAGRKEAAARAKAVPKAKLAELEAAELYLLSAPWCLEEKKGSSKGVEAPEGWLASQSFVFQIEVT